MQSFVSGVFHLATCHGAPSTLLLEPGVGPFSLLSGIPLQLCHLSPGLCLDSDDYKAAANFYIQALGGHAFISLGSGIVRTYGRHVLT